MTYLPDRHDPSQHPLCRSKRWRRHVGATVVVVSLIGAACGSDDATSTPAGDDSDETSTSTEPAAAAPDGVLTDFCDATIEGEALFNTGPQLDEDGTPTPDALEEFSAQISPATDSIEQNAPEEIADSVEALLRGVRAAIEDGDDSIMDTPEFFRADAAIDAYVYDNCELDGNQDIIAVDYAFEGLPDTVGAGQVGIRMDNQGTEVHEIVILRVNDGVDLSVDELLELPEDEAVQATEFRGVAFAPPGEQASAVIDLEAGRHIAICFIPIGTASMLGAGPPDESAGPPHFTQGMVQEFTVE